MRSFKTLVKTPYEKMIVACLKSRDATNLQEIEAIYRQCQEKRLFSFAQEHECGGIVASRLRSMGKSTPEWDAVADDWKYRLNLRFDALESFACALEAEGIPVVALKNAGIARGIYPHYEECPMGDFDVLVRKCDFERAHQIALSEDFELGFRAEETIEKEGVAAGLLSGGTEYKKDLGDDILWLELQWRPIAGRWIAPEVEPNADDLLATSMPILESKIRLLDPISNLLQVSLHTAKHSYIRAPGLRLHTDVDRIVRAYPNLDWEAFLARVIAMRVKTAVYFSLQIAADLLDTPVPERILTALRPPVHQAEFLFRCLAKGGLFHPLRHKFSRVEYLAFTAMLFDSPIACLQSAFPSPAYMRAHYQTTNAHLPGIYAKRLAQLLFKRVRT